MGSSGGPEDSGSHGQKWVRITHRNPRQSYSGQKGAESPATGWVWVVWEPLWSLGAPSCSGTQTCTSDASF